MTVRFPRKGEPTADAATNKGQVEWATSELHSIARTIATVQTRLEEANKSGSIAANVQTTEVEITRLALEVDRFSDETIAKLENLACSQDVQC
jgi:uncharacterized protein YPO0396